MFIGHGIRIPNLSKTRGNPLLGLINKYGVPGLVFDNSPPTVFQDAAGTLAAGIGDVIGKELDLSSGGHNVEQSTTAAKPILRAGPLLEFDGVDDFLKNTAQPLTGDELTVIFCGKYRITPAGLTYVFSVADGVSNTTYFGFGAGTDRLRMVVNNGGAIDTLQGTSPVGTSKFVGSIRLNNTAGEISLDQIRDTQVMAQVPNFTTLESLGIGAMVRPSTFGYSALDLDYVFAINKELTTAELEQSEEYIAGLCGVTL